MLKRTLYVIIEDGEICTHWSTSDSYGYDDPQIKSIRIDDAVHKQDIKDAINRYFIKPLSK